MTPVDNELTVRLQGLGIEPSSLEEDDRGTIVVQLEIDDDITRVQPDFSHLSRAVDFGAPLGKGGQAEVFSGTQKALRREVAIKQLRRDKADPERAARLLMEARVQGALEHPAVLPVYMLGADEEGLPQIVMRSVVGRPWSSYVRPGGELEAPPDEPDHMRWHLDVLMQIAAAVQYAHDRGVLHRDLKLSNVLIGPQGEPYLLDWGLAARLDDRCQIGLPLANEEDRVVGTPAYMAPEQAAVEPHNVSARTDVYLLGACLHVVLAGQARHAAATVIERLAKAYRSRPWEYPPGVPVALAAIANKATARQPEDRYGSAAAFRAALRDWLRRPIEIPTPTPAPPARAERPLSADWPGAGGPPTWLPAAALAAGVVIGLILGSVAC